MKKLLCIVVCLVFMSSAFGQEIFKVPERTPEQKHKRAIYTQWNIMSSAVSFAKSHGVSPYEYGKYAGNLFTPSWNKQNSFIGFGQETIYYWDNWRTNDDAAIFIVKETNKSLVLKIPVNGLKEYFESNENFGVSFDEMIQCMKGIEEQIAEYSGCTFKIEIEEEWSPCTTIYFTFATIIIEKGDFTVKFDNVSSAKDKSIVKDGASSRNGNNPINKKQATRQ